MTATLPVGSVWSRTTTRCFSLSPGLASNTRFGFGIKPTAWRKFLGGHPFAVHNRAIKFEQKKIDLDAYINGAPQSQQN